MSGRGGQGDAGTDQPDDRAPAAEERLSEPAWVRKRRLAEIFGDVLPETTRDERDEGRGPHGEDPGDAWLKSQVPPHHGG